MASELSLWLEAQSFSQLNDLPALWVLLFSLCLKAKGNADHFV
jgi:hypothetical protein